MFKTTTSSLLTSLVDKVLRPIQLEMKTEWNKDGLITQPGMIMQMDMRADNYEENGNHFMTNTNVYFIFTGNTSVFFYTDWEEDDLVYRFEDIPLEDFKNTSNHDSCWRSDGVNSPISNLYFEMCDEINRQSKEKELEEIAPINIETSADFKFGPVSPWKMATVTHKTSPDNDYHRVLVGIEILND